MMNDSSPIISEAPGVGMDSTAARAPAEGAADVGAQVDGSRSPKGDAGEPLPLRQQIIGEIMSLLKPVERTAKPSIAELERILNSEDVNPLRINPDGSVSEMVATTTTVGAVADKIIALLDSKAPEHETNLFGPPTATAVVVKYDPDVSLLHPLNKSFLNDIGKVWERAHRQHGWTECWMAVYNECVRVGALAHRDPTDHRENAARAEAHARARAAAGASP